MGTYPGSLSRLGCDHGGEVSADQHANPTAHEVGRQRRETVILAVRPAILDCDVLTFGVASFLQPWRSADKAGIEAIKAMLEARGRSSRIMSQLE
jgi:hypothetical protein